MASIASSTSSKKRKRGETKFYAVRIGKQPGVYHSWADCLDQVKGIKGAIYKAFPSLTEAEGFVKNQNMSTPGKSTSNAKFYAVRRGRRPGVYLDWPSAQQQITGWTKPKHKSFSTRAEAEEFMRETSSDELTTISGRITSVRVAGTDASTEPGERSQPPAKKRKSTGAVALRIGEDENTAAGHGPMPADAEDGFDPTIKLDAETGKLRYRTASEMQATKIMPRANPTPGEPVIIYTDGACRGNGQKGSIAGVGVFFGPQDPRNVAEPLPGPRQTNQRAELAALKRALDICPMDRNVVIFSDSNYAIKCVTEWFQNWEARGWVGSNRKPVENRDLVEEILTRIRDRELCRSKTDFKWVKGHGTDPGNVAADALAVRGAEEARANGVRR